jgi:hypothetical protein
MRHLIVMAVLAAASPAAAGSQSSNSSTNCSNGHCTRVESLVIEDRWGRRGYVRRNQWHEHGRRHERRHGGEIWLGVPGWYRLAPPRRWRDDDDDD